MRKKKILTKLTEEKYLKKLKIESLEDLAISFQIFQINEKGEKILVKTRGPKVNANQLSDNLSVDSLLKETREDPRHSNIELPIKSHASKIEKNNFLIEISIISMKKDNDRNRKSNLNASTSTSTSTSTSISSGENITSTRSNSNRNPLKPLIFFRDVTKKKDLKNLQLLNNTSKKTTFNSKSKHWEVPLFIQASYLDTDTPKELIIFLDNKINFKATIKNKFFLNDCSVLKSSEIEVHPRSLFLPLDNLPHICAQHCNILKIFLKAIFWLSHQTVMCPI